MLTQLTSIPSPAPSFLVSSCLPPYSVDVDELDEVCTSKRGVSRVSGLSRRWWIEGRDVPVAFVLVVISDALDVAGLGRSPAEADADALALLDAALLNVIAGIDEGEPLRLLGCAARPLFPLACMVKCRRMG